MSAVQDLVDKVSGIWEAQISRLRAAVFGPNNEKLDFVMDSFYKLEAPKQKMVVGALFASVALLVFGLFGLYLTQVRSLKTQLNDSFSALAEIRELQKESQAVNSKFQKITDTILRKNRSINFKPLFEKISKRQKVELRGIRENNVSLSSDNPISEKMQEVHIKMEVQNVSIPRLLKFLTEVERSDHYLRVHNINISSRHGSKKLYFDSDVVIRAYKPAKK